MGRHCEVRLPYFPFFSSSFTDDEDIVYLRRTHGPVGILTYINLRCRVYLNGYYAEYKDIDTLCASIAEQITSVQIARTAKTVKTVINDLIGRGTLNEALFTEKHIITSETWQEEYFRIAAKMKRKTDVGAYCLIPEVVGALDDAPKIPISSEEKPISSEEKQQNIKYKNNTTTTTFIFLNDRDQKSKNVENSVGKAVDKPSLGDVSQYMYDIGVGNVEREAPRFVNYNDVRGWVCLPDWQAAVRRWIDLKGGS